MQLPHLSVGDGGRGMMTVGLGEGGPDGNLDGSQWADGTDAQTILGRPNIYIRNIARHNREGPIGVAVAIDEE